MPIDDPVSPARRGLLKRGVVLVTLGSAAVTTSPAAAGTTAKTDVKYQFTPNGSAHCSLCASFIQPPEAGGGPGTCKIVAGPIPQNGWCVLFSPAR